MVDMIRKRKKEYYTSQVQQAQGNAKKMWDVINNVVVKPTKSSVIPDSVDTSAVEKFNSHFTTIGSHLASQVPSTQWVSSGNAMVCSFTIDEIDYPEIVNVISMLTDRKAPGHDGIPVHVLMDNIGVLGSRLFRLFNYAIIKVVYPDNLNSKSVTNF